MAAYRFFDNDKVEWRTNLEPRWQQTHEHMQDHVAAKTLRPLRDDDGDDISV